MSDTNDIEVTSNELTSIFHKLKAIEEQYTAFRKETQLLSRKAKNLVYKLHQDLMEKDPIVWCIFNYCTYDDYRRRRIGIGEDICNCRECFEIMDSIYETELEANNAKTQKELIDKEVCYVKSLSLKEADMLGAEGGLVYDFIQRKHGLPWLI